jgi:hypothetical protein
MVANKRQKITKQNAMPRDVESPHCRAHLIQASNARQFWGVT